MGGCEVDVLAALERAVHRFSQPTLRAAGEPLGNRAADRRLGAQPTHRCELRAAVLGVEEILDVEREVEPPQPVAQVKVDLGEARRDDGSVVGRGAVAGGSR